MRPLKACVIAANIFLLSACGQNEQAPQAPPPPPAVIVAVVTQQNITPSVTFNGRVEAIDTVELRARVEGFIEKRLFAEGAEVEAGDLMIVLEKAPAEAQIEQIRGQITAAEGSLQLAQIEVDRQTTLVEREATARSNLDAAKAKYSQALGEVQRLQAALRSAQIDLSYTDIKAPISGRIGRFAYSTGDFVTPSSGPLAVIVSQDPMYVAFPVSSRQLLEVRKDASSKGQDPRAVVNVKIRLPDGSIYGKAGTIDFVDVQVDQTTDTVIVRATVPNPDRILIHNQLVGVIVEEKTPTQALVIPQAALAVNQAGPYVLVVGEDNEVEQRQIETGSPQDSKVTVTQGLKQGEKVIVEGMQKVRPGQRVEASVAAEAETGR